LDFYHITIKGWIMQKTNIIAVGLGFVIACISLLPSAEAKEVERKVIPVLCSGLAVEGKPLIAVMDFKMRTNASSEIGSGMASMLSNALINSGCFQVVERARLGDIMDEQAFGLSGAVEESTAASVGRIKGTRYQIMGEITEFSEKESGLSAGTRFLGRVIGRSGSNAAAAAVQQRVAHIGFIIKIVDTSTAMVIGSESFNKKHSATGLAGEGWSGRSAIRGNIEISQAMADALEDGIIEAVNFLAPYRENMVTTTKSVQKNTSSTVESSLSECALLQPDRVPPRIMVIIPEEHITGYWGSYVDKSAFRFEEPRTHSLPDQRPSVGDSAAAAASRIIRPPDPAGETEIMKKLIARGFYVVDDRQMEALRQEARFREASGNGGLAADIGREFGADVVITGEAFSEFPGKVEGMMPARARVEARAIETRTARIIAIDGFHASAIDISEVIAGKTALRKAGGLVADAFIQQICDDKGLAREMSAATATSTVTKSVGTGGAITDFEITGVTFESSTALKSALLKLQGVTKVTIESFNSKIVTFAVQYSGSTGDLAEAILSNTEQFPIEITGFESGKISAKVK
jgi:curli biogenesis system outer membrane secretion channel CsgG